MKILGLIPARGGSKGIPGKNIKLLGGKPLLQYTFKDARNSRLLSKVVLSSEDYEIIQVAEKLGLEVPFVRPPELARDSSSSLELVLHALEYFEARGESFDAVCLLQPTTPLRRQGLIDAAIEKFTQGNYDSLISVREVPEEYNPHWVFEERDGNLKIATGETQIISRRQELPKTYHRDGAIYLTKTEILKKEQSLYGRQLGFIDCSDDAYVNIDVPADWERAEELIKSRS